MFSSLAKFLASSLLLVNVISCDNGTTEGKGVIAPSTGDAVFYEIHDKSCQVDTSASASLFLDAQTINFDTDQIDSKAERITYEFGETQGLPKFKSASISNVDYHVPGKTDNSTYLKLAKGSSFKVCNKDYSYPNNSIESITLKAEHILTKVHRYYNKLITHNPLGSIQLSVQPKVLDVSSEGESLPATDNAFFSVFGAEGPRIVFLPHSKRWSKKFGEHNTLWNMPGVTAHEYGHFVFHHNLKSTLSTAVFNTRNSCFHNFAEEPQNADQSSHSRGNKELIFGALNEGFADIFAHTSLKNTLDIPFEIKIQCLNIDRDLDDGNFSSGTPKKMTASVIETFLDVNSNPKLSSNNPCRETDFTDNHKIGAIIAFGFQEMIKSSNTLSDDQRFKVQIHFLENLYINHRNISSYPSTDKILSFILNQFVDSLEKIQSTSLNSNQCNMLKDTFIVLPDLVDELKLADNSRCRASTPLIETELELLN